MSIALALLAGATVFFIGFCMGLNPPAKHKAAARDRADFDKILTAQMQEYRNFLNYDGSAQQ